MQRAVIYARQSLDRSGEALAVSRQLSECRSLVERNGWETAAEYVDNDVSASDGKPRAEWSRLLTDFSAGRFDTVVCWHTDRLYRRLIDLVSLIELAERQALRIVAVRSGDIDLTTPSGRMIAGMLGSAARFEMEQKGDRQAAANRKRAMEGDVRWTRRPFGYDRRDERIIEIKSEAAELRIAASRVLAGGTLASVVADLNGRNIPTSTGGEWSVTTLRRVLLNPRHAGKALYRGEDMGDGTWPAILDAETHERLTAILTNPARRTAPSTASKYLLSGIVRCGRCGQPMFASPMGMKGRRWMVYRCRTAHNARRMDLVDGVVEEVVFARLSQPDVLALLSPVEDVSALAAESQELRERLDGLGELYADGTLTKAALREATANLKGRLADLQAKISSITGMGPLASLVSSDDIRAHWPTMNLQARRSVIDALITVTILPAGKGARFTPEQVDIEWRTP